MLLPKIIKKPLYSAATLLVATSLTMGAWMGAAFAANPTGGQVTTRSIAMSSSAPSATGVTYTIKFTPVTSEASGEVIVDFCDNSPLYNDTCTATAAGTDVPDTSSVSGTGVTNDTGTGSANHTIKVTGLTITSGTPLTITANNVKNPSNVGSVGSFYARILTYATGGAAGYTPANGSAPTLGSPVDYGGDALSTANSITIQAKVFETLAFCVYQTSCTSGTGNAAVLTLGDPTTGALSTTNNYINNNAKYTIATNAGSGVQVLLKGNTLCNSGTPANCTTGSNSQYTITPMTTTPATLPAAGGANEGFGMCAYNGGNANISIATAFKDTVNSCTGGAQVTGTYSGTSLFGWDNTNATGNGATVMSSTGALSSTSGQFIFGASIAATTEAGIYTGSYNLIATSTF